MKTTVAKIVTGWTNSALRCPYVYALGACGHGGDVRLRPRRIACYDCGVERADPDKYPCVACGKACGRVLWMPDPHRAEDRLTQIGDEMDCAECDRYALALAKLRALTPADVQHARFRPYDSRGGREGAFHVYRRDESSPSGVLLLMSIDATPEADEILRGLRASPLSPTEGMRVVR